MNGTKLGRMTMNEKSSVIIWNTEELHNEWNQIAETYRFSDSTMQTFYYSLVNMMELNKAEHILEVACGTGKLLPLAMSLKQLDCTYLASDFSEKMIKYSLETIDGYLDKMGVEMLTEEWMDRNNLTLQVANCMKPIPSEYKFDRIIANLVLQGGQEPEVMMRNFYKMAEEGCLLGVGVWGKEEDNNIFNMIPEALQVVKGVKKPERHTSFRCLDRLKQLGEISGWELVTEWYQTAPFVYKNADENLMNFLIFTARGDKALAEYLHNRCNQILEEKKPLIFAAQLAIYRKKAKLNEEEEEE